MRDDEVQYSIRIFEFVAAWNNEAKKVISQASINLEVKVGDTGK